MATPRTKTRRTGGRAESPPFSVRARDPASGKVVKMTADKAYEMFIGGTVGMWARAGELGLSSKAVLVAILKEAVAKAPPRALLAVYRKLDGGPMPVDIDLDAAVLAVSRETPRGKRRRKSPQLPATPRRGRG